MITIIFNLYFNFSICIIPLNYSLSQIICKINIIVNINAAIITAAAHIFWTSKLTNQLLNKCCIIYILSCG